MVERVARAIYVSAGMHSSSEEVRKRWPWEKATDLHEKYLAIARAAIEEMTEPTAGMIEAGRPSKLYDDDTAAHWRAMIGKALGE
jgi:hypothetical protein